MEKYITDNGHGASKSDAKRGFSDEMTEKRSNDSFEDWAKEHKERVDYEQTGFGRDTGDAR